MKFPIEPLPDATPGARPGHPRNRRRLERERGVTAIQLLVILVPVVLGFLGFALDLGMLYSSKGELKTAADAMALAAASRLNGTDSSTGDATAEAQNTIETQSGSGNRFYFHGYPIGQTTNGITSTVDTPSYFAAVADALGSAGGGNDVTGSQARHVRINVTGQTQLLFWSFLPLVTDRRISVMASSVAGISAPLCLACSVEPFAVAAPNPSDPVDFGFITDTKYSFTYLCTGNPPTLLAPGTSLLSYILLNRQDDNAPVYSDPSSQVFRDLAGGLPGSTNSALACFRINNTEIVWPNAVPQACARGGVAPLVTESLCGLATRFDPTTPVACAGIPSVDILTTAYSQDTDLADHDSYVDYIGNGRRLVTLPVVDTLSAAAPMTVLGFRQFLLIPASGANVINAADALGRFVALYAGSVAPVKQGRFDGCSIANGPGKVVLHQ
jgi:Flp pilus assembly protein TadG